MQKIHDFHSIIDRLTTSQRISNRVPRNYGIDVELYTNEIHLLDIVEKYPQYNLSEIATRIQMSKMAISALAKKLQAKPSQIMVLAFLKPYTSVKTSPKI